MFLLYVVPSIVCRTASFFWEHRVLFWRAWQEVALCGSVTDCHSERLVCGFPEGRSLNARRAKLRRFRYLSAPLSVCTGSYLSVRGTGAMASRSLWSLCLLLALLLPLEGKALSRTPPQIHMFCLLCRTLIMRPYNGVDRPGSGRRSFWLRAQMHLSHTHSEY